MTSGRQMGRRRNQSATGTGASASQGPKAPWYKRWSTTGTAAAGTALVIAAVNWCSGGPATEPIQQECPEPQTKVDIRERGKRVEVEVPRPCKQGNVCLSVSENGIVARGDDNDICSTGEWEHRQKTKITTRRGDGAEEEATVLRSEIRNGRFADGSRALSNEWHMTFDRASKMFHVAIPCSVEQEEGRSSKRDRVERDTSEPPPTVVKAPVVERPPTKVPWNTLSTFTVPPQIADNLETLVGGRNMELREKGCNRVTIRLRLVREGSRGVVRFEGASGGRGCDLYKIISRPSFVREVGNVPMAYEGSDRRASIRIPVQ